MHTVNIPQRLKDLRKETGFTQQNVADGINIKRTAYQAYEEGRATPPLPVIFSMCSFYGKMIDELLGIKESELKQSGIMDAYYRADPEKRRLIDFILNLNC